MIYLCTSPNTQLYSFIIFLHLTDILSLFIALENYQDKLHALIDSSFMNMVLYQYLTVITWSFISSWEKHPNSWCVACCYPSKKIFSNCWSSFKFKWPLFVHFMNIAYWTTNSQTKNKLGAYFLLLGWKEFHFQLSCRSLKLSNKKYTGTPIQRAPIQC